MEQTAPPYLMIALFSLGSSLLIFILGRLFDMARGNGKATSGELPPEHWDRKFQSVETRVDDLAELQRTVVDLTKLLVRAMEKQTELMNGMDKMISTQNEVLREIREEQRRKT